MSNANGFSRRRGSVEPGCNALALPPSYFPQGVSQALGGEPDAFQLREGMLTFKQNNHGQTVLIGGDKNSVICHPHQIQERTKGSISLLVRDNSLRLAKPKGKDIPVHLDTQFVHLLTLQGMPQGELTVGKKWKGTTGRLRPFTGYSTQYEIVGFAEIAGRKTVNVKFSGDVPNIAQLPGVNAEKLPTNATMTNKHQGNAYFDLETGCLVRQEIEMTTVSGGLKGSRLVPDSSSPDTLVPRLSHDTQASFIPIRLTDTRSTTLELTMPTGMHMRLIGVAPDFVIEVLKTLS